MLVFRIKSIFIIIIIIIIRFINFTVPGMISIFKSVAFIKYQTSVSWPSFHYCESYQS